MKELIIFIAIVILSLTSLLYQSEINKMLVASVAADNLAQETAFGAAIIDSHISSINKQIDMQNEKSDEPSEKVPSENIDGAREKGWAEKDENASEEVPSEKDENASEDDAAENIEKEREDDAAENIKKPSKENKLDKVKIDPILHEYAEDAIRFGASSGYLKRVGASIGDYEIVVSNDKLSIFLSLSVKTSSIIAFANSVNHRGNGECARLE